MTAAENGHKAVPELLPDTTKVDIVTRDDRYYM